MSRRRIAAEAPLDRIAELLEEAPAGLHDLRPAEGGVDVPAQLAELYVLAGCGTLHGSAQVGPDLKPRLGTSISVPLGK